MERFFNGLWFNRELMEAHQRNVRDYVNTPLRARRGICWFLLVRGMNQVFASNAVLMDRDFDW